MVKLFFKRTYRILISFGALFTTCLLANSCGYNTLVQLDEAVKQQLGQVQASYQRRADLIPNLVNTVKGYAKHEQETLQKVIEARGQATKTEINLDNLSSEQLNRFQASQRNLSSAIGRLLLVAERYPDLKSNQNFLELQAQLEGTENRIAVERRKFNEAVGSYNKYVRAFPQNIIAKLFGFREKGYFESDPSASKAPGVNF